MSGFSWLLSAIAVLLAGVALWVAIGKEPRASARTEPVTMHASPERTPLAATPVAPTQDTSSESTQAVAGTVAVAADTLRTDVEVEARDSNRPIRLQVLNGCGVKGLAKVIAPGLRAKGFDVREVRNAGHFRHEMSELIDRTGRTGPAEIVADSLGISRERIRREDSTSLVDIDVTLIVGADYERLGITTKSSR